MKVNKMFFAWQEEKEREFLEEKAREGYRLVNAYIGRYEFEQCEPCELVYQFDFKGIDSTPEDEYLQLFSDDGWTYISRVGGWYYFYKEQVEGEDISLYNDYDSIKKKYQRLLLFLGITGFPIYYMNLFMFPLMVDRLGGIGMVYGIARGLFLILMLVHIYAGIRIFKKFNTINKQISE